MSTDISSENENEKDDYPEKSTVSHEAEQLEISSENLKDFENRRKILANKSPQPIVANFDEWRNLQAYRFHQMKNKDNNIMELWPMYSNPDGACLVSISNVKNESIFNNLKF